MSRIGNVRISAFDICTPKIIGGDLQTKRFDAEQFYYLLRIIESLSDEQKTYHHNNKMIQMKNYTYSDDKDFIQGFFIAARYGKDQEIIDVFTSGVEGMKKKNQGVKNEIPFVVDMRNGLLLVARDAEQIIGRDILHRYFRNFVEECDAYRKAFNKLNIKNKAVIWKRSFIRIITLPSREFFEEISRFARIKEAIVYKDIDSEKKCNPAIETLTKLAKDNGLDDYQQTSFAFRNNVKKGSVRHIQTFFEKLIEAEEYDDYGVNGVYESGRAAYISYGNVPQSFDIKTVFNEAGVPDYSDIIIKMVEIAKKDNPLIDKNKYKTALIEVGNIDDIQKEQKSSEGKIS